MRPTVVVGVGALTLAIVLSGTVATAEGVQPTTYRSLQEARFRPVILPTNTGTDVPKALVDARVEGPLNVSSDTPRLIADASGADTRAAAPTPAPSVTPPSVTPTAAATASPTAAPTRTTTTAGAVQGVVASGWLYDPEVSWYGPGFYGHRTACGYALTETLIGVANRTLPCGTKVAFRYGSRVIIAPVVDRGPYVAGRRWDLTAGLAIALGHLFTGPLDWRLE